MLHIYTRFFSLIYTRFTHTPSILDFFYPICTRFTIFYPSIPDSYVYSTDFYPIYKSTSIPWWLWSGDGAWQLLEPGRPTDSDISRTRAYCASSRSEKGLFKHYHIYMAFSFCLGDGPIQTTIMSQRAVKRKTTNQLDCNFFGRGY